MSADFTALLYRFTEAVEAGDGAALAALFCPDGVYTDTFYGAFAGREAIGGMLQQRFHGDAQDFKWDMHSPVFDGRLGYASWLFSYTSRMPDSRGRRVVFEGMSRFAIEDGLIRTYDEVFSAGITFVQLGMPAGRIEKILARLAEQVRQRPDAARHLTQD